MRRVPGSVLISALLCLTAACGTDAVTVAPTTTATTATATEDSPSATTTAGTSTTSPESTSTSTIPASTSTSTTLPDPASVPRQGTGEFTYATAGSFVVEGSPMIEFSVAVEDGTGVDVDDLADFVVATLGDSRSWVGRGAGFRIVEDGGLFTLAVATPDTVDELCLPLQTIGEYSCARNGWIALNLVRWETATTDWEADLETYRHYLVNHEVGHYIVGPNHESCPGPGELAPVMMQQTKGLDGCVANGWVDP